MNTFANGSISKHDWNLRDVHHLNERVAAALSLLLNTALSAVLVNEKNEIMKPYSRVLLQNCLVDYFYAIVCLLVEIVS